MGKRGWARWGAVGSEALTAAAVGLAAAWMAAAAPWGSSVPPERPSAAAAAAAARLEADFVPVAVRMAVRRPACAALLAAYVGAVRERAERTAPARWPEATGREESAAGRYLSFGCPTGPMTAAIWGARAAAAP